MTIKQNKEFTLIEWIVVISIIGILAAVAVPAYGGYVKKVNEEVCRINCVQVERMYGMYVETDGIEHSDTVFEQFVQEQGKDICTEHGDISYVDGKVQCSVHAEEVHDGDGDGDVPYL